MTTKTLDEKDLSKLYRAKRIELELLKIENESLLDDTDYWYTIAGELELTRDEQSIMIKELECALAAALKELKDK